MRNIVLIFITSCAIFLLIGFVIPKQYFIIYNIDGIKIESIYEPAKHDKLLYKPQSSIENRFNFQLAGICAATMLIVGNLIILITITIKRNLVQENNTRAELTNKNHKKSIFLNLGIYFMTTIIVSLIGIIIGGNTQTKVVIVYVSVTIVILYILPLVIAGLASIFSKSFNLRVFIITFWIILCFRLITTFLTLYPKL